MIESTARAERFDLQTSKSPSYVWEVPQKPVAVRIPFSVMDRLEREAVEAFRSLSSRGSEIGGLLVGDLAGGNPLVVSIADYELIQCDYSRGPLYRLSEADMERFQRAMEQHKGGAGHTVAGFFRSHTRKGIALDADDLAFYQAVFREPHHIGLLVRPFATKASTAGIFIWENGKIQGDASYLEFPFRSAELGGKGVVDTPPPAASKPPVTESKAAAPAPPAASSSAAKPPARAQIVPIASRRDPEPSAPAAPPVAAAPATPAAKPEPPKAEEKTAPADKNKFDNKQARKDNKPAEQPKASAPASAPAKPEPSKAAPAPAKPADPPKAAAAAPAPAKTPAPSKPAEKAAETHKGGKGMKLILAAAATIALFVGMFVYPGFLRHSNKPPVAGQGDSSPLQLRVERSNGDLLLTWNRDTDAIRNATKATLLITDGAQTENVDMDLSQLRNNGSIMYSPSSSDVSFKMEVIGRDQSKTTSEIVRMLRTRPSPLDAQQADTAKPAPVVTQTPVAPAPAKTNDKPAATANATPAEDQTPAPEAPKPVVPRKEFNAASLAQRIRPAVSSDIPDAPTVGSTTSAGVPGVNLPVVGAVPSAPVPPPVRPNAPAPTPAAPAPSAPATTAGSPKQGGNIQSAVLISRKEPEYPKIAKQTGAKGVVTLNATIGKDGHIKTVKVVSGHPMLQNAAVEAVKQWIYKPTLLNGTPVETETQIMLNFVGDR